MRKFIIRNTNKNRDAFYERCGNVAYLKNKPKYESKPAWWLQGDYVTHSSGATHNDITRAHLYNDEKAAQKQCDKLNEKFAVGSEHFHPRYGHRYPDSVGKKGYAKCVPEYEVVEVEVSVKEVKR